MASQWRQATTDFAAQLAGLAAIVEVKEGRRCTTVGATTSARQGMGTTSANRCQRTTMLAPILSTQWLPVQGGRDRWRSRRLGQGSAGIDVEIAIVRMLLAEIVTRLRFGLSSGEDRLQLVDKFLQVLAGKFPTEPKCQAWYAAHGGESLGNLVSSANEGLRRETSPRSSFLIKPDSAHSAPRLEPSQATRFRSKPGGESRNAGFSHEFNRISP